jgi:hypothetical protein
VPEAIRIRYILSDGRPTLLLELFEVPLASTSDPERIREFRRDPNGFTRTWSDYFAGEIATLLAERIQQNGRGAGWSMATRLAPRITQ